MVSSKRACKAAMASWCRCSWAANTSRPARSHSSLASFSRCKPSALACSTCSRAEAFISSTWRCHAEAMASPCAWAWAISAPCAWAWAISACRTSVWVSRACLLFFAMRLPIRMPIPMPTRAAIIISMSVVFLRIYSFTSHFSMFLASLLKLTPTLNILRPSASKGRAYCLSSICRKASSAVPSSLNSIT